MPSAALAWALALALLLAPVQRRLEWSCAHPGSRPASWCCWREWCVLLPAMLTAERWSMKWHAAGVRFARCSNPGFGVAMSLLIPCWYPSRSGGAPVRPARDRECGELLVAGTVASLARESLLQVIGMVMTRPAVLFPARSPDDLGSIERCPIEPCGHPTHVRQRRRYRACHGLRTLVVHWCRAAGWTDVLVAGLPAPLLWGVLMGCWRSCRCWGPSSLDSVGRRSCSGRQRRQGPAVDAVGRDLVGGIDNLLYPMLVGKRLKLHTRWPSFHCRGLALFGSAGLILGPVIFAITRQLLEIWNRRGERFAPAWSGP